MAGLSHEPGHLGRLGPITPAEACGLAGLAVTSPAAQWRIIVTNRAGQALAVTRIPRPRNAEPAAAGIGTGNGPDGPGWLDGSGNCTGLVGRVTLTIPEDFLPPGPAPGTGPVASLPDGILSQARYAASRAAERAAAQAAADDAAGGCAHTAATSAYRPPPRLKERITARDLICRFPGCRQPAWRGDLDHTRPYDKGGLTCSCNLGGLCRRHHILKQHPSWQLIQPQPGIFEWTTPTGRRYMTIPEIHPT
jgi:hypothetical protein